MSSWAQPVDLRHMWMVHVGPSATITPSISDDKDNNFLGLHSLLEQMLTGSGTTATMDEEASDQAVSREAQSSIDFTPDSKKSPTWGLDYFYMLALYLQPSVELSQTLVVEHVGKHVSRCEWDRPDLRRFYEFAIQMSRQVDYRGRVSERLAGLIIVVNQRLDEASSCGVDRYVHTAPGFQPAGFDHWSGVHEVGPPHIAQYLDKVVQDQTCPPPFQGPSDSDLTEWINLNAVVSRVYGKLHADDEIMFYSLTSFREAFEEYEENTGLTITNGIVAAYWMLNYGGVIFRACFDFAHDLCVRLELGEKYKAFLKTTPEHIKQGGFIIDAQGEQVHLDLTRGRWARWKLGFRRLSQREPLGRWLARCDTRSDWLEDARDLASEAYQEMVRLEYLSDYHKGVKRTRQSEETEEADNDREVEVDIGSSDSSIRYVSEELNIEPDLD